MRLRLVVTAPVEEPNRAWWNTELAKAYELGGLASELFIRHMFPKPIGMPENDRDHCRW